MKVSSNYLSFLVLCTGALGTSAFTLPSNKVSKTALNVYQTYQNTWNSPWRRDRYNTYTNGATGSGTRDPWDPLSNIAREPLGRDSMGPVGPRPGTAQYDQYESMNRNVSRRNRPGYRPGYDTGYRFPGYRAGSNGSYSNDRVGSGVIDVEVVQGGTLKTFNNYDSRTQEVQLTSDGRPIEAEVEVWQGPDNTPQRMKVYSEDGYERPFTTVVETPSGRNTAAVRNTGNMEFPFSAGVSDGIRGQYGYPGEHGPTATVIQGGALRTFEYDYQESVAVFLSTDGRPLEARIELLQGPSQVKQVVEVYSEDGMERPFFCVLETPGHGNVVRIVNTSPLTFPLTASVEGANEGGLGARRYGGGSQYGSRNNRMGGGYGSNMYYDNNYRDSYRYNDYVSNRYRNNNRNDYFMGRDYRDRGSYGGYGYGSTYDNSYGGGSYNGYGGYNNYGRGNSGSNGYYGSGSNAYGGRTYGSNSYGSNSYGSNSYRGGYYR